MRIVLVHSVLDEASVAAATPSAFFIGAQQHSKGAFQVPSPQPYIEEL